TEREDGGHREGSIFVVGVDRTFRGDNGGNTTDGGSHGQQRRKLRLEFEQSPQQGHQGQRKRDFNDHQAQADASQFQDIGQHKARTQQHDTNFQPKLVGGDACVENSGDGQGVGYHEAQENRPKNILDV